MRNTRSLIGHARHAIKSCAAAKHVASAWLAVPPSARLPPLEDRLTALLPELLLQVFDESAQVGLLLVRAVATAERLLVLHGLERRRMQTVLPVMSRRSEGPLRR
jgi:hypothetical protein